MLEKSLTTQVKKDLKDFIVFKKKGKMAKRAYQVTPKTTLT